MYNKYIAIITAENKEKYIANTINSCLKNSINGRLKIIIIYTHLSNEKFLKHKFKHFKNVIFLKSFLKRKYPTQDQLYKIYKALKYVKNEWVLLLDGDDLFKYNKIKVLDQLELDSEKIYLHSHETQVGKIKSVPKDKIYKKIFLYKKLFNDWPEKINTSSIVIRADLLKKFYKNYNPYKWKYLAIDVQLILYYFYKDKYKYLIEKLTTKIENINNLDKSFSNIFKKKYWVRRMEQHELTKKLSGKINCLDRFITFLFLKTLR